MVHPPEADTVVVRYGDISTKSSRVQRMMEDVLVENIRSGLDTASIDHEIEREWTRPIVHVEPADIEAAAQTVASTFGVVAANPAVCVPSERDAILDAVATTAKAIYTGGTFAIRARRSDKSLPFTSSDLEHEAGSVVFDAVDGFEPEVDLDDPDVTISIEARRDHSFVSVSTNEGPAGLPVGVQSPMVALISGGIDSPVAAYRAMRRGSPIVPVYIDLGPYAGPDHRARALESIATLYEYAGTAKRPTHIIDAGDVATALDAEIGRGRMLVLRRFMFAVADRLADEINAVGIVTGEALGQKSSQTASNLHATGAGIDRPIHRPLLDLDKAEITEMAKAIGTYRSATVDAGCASLVPDSVITDATPGGVDNLVPNEMSTWVEHAVQDATKLQPAALTAMSTPSPS